MGAVDKFLNAVNFKNKAEYEDDYFDEEDDTMEEELEERREKKASRVSSINRSKRSSSDDFDIVGFEPKTYTDAETVMDYLLNGKTVALKLNSISAEEAVRLLDMVNGCSYAVNGHLKEFSQNIYIVAPNKVNINGAFLNNDDKND